MRAVRSREIPLFSDNADCRSSFFSLTVTPRRRRTVLSQLAARRGPPGEETASSWGARTVALGEASEAGERSRLCMRLCMRLCPHPQPARSHTCGLYGARAGGLCYGSAHTACPLRRARGAGRHRCSCPLQRSSPPQRSCLPCARECRPSCIGPPAARPPLRSRSRPGTAHGRRRRPCPPDRAAPSM